MSFVLKALIAVVLGTALGLWVTEAAVTRGFLFGVVAAGQWSAFPTTGSPGIDPYAKAILARTAFVPVGTDEGVTFFTTKDSDGRPLQATCIYALDNGDPAARFWTLGLFDAKGAAVANPADRYALTSQEVLRIDGRFTIAISTLVQPGNWLPAPAAGPFTLVYTLYEPNGGTAVSASADAALPVVRRGTCQS